jgi:hypothetical protein
MKPFADLRGYLRQEFGLGHYKVKADGDVLVIDPQDGLWKLYGKTGKDDEGEFCDLAEWAKSRQVARRAARSKQ